MRNIQHWLSQYIASEVATNDVPYMCTYIYQQNIIILEGAKIKLP